MSIIKTIKMAWTDIADKATDSGISGLMDVLRTDRYRKRLVEALEGLDEAVGGVKDIFEAEGGISKCFFPGSVIFYELGMEITIKYTKTDILFSMEL